MMLAAVLLLPRLLTADAAPPPGALKLEQPRVNYRANIASATTSPWVVANGWRMLRKPESTFIYDVKGETAGLAAAEAFTYGVTAYVAADKQGAAVFGHAIDILKTVPEVHLSPVADFGVIEDGSEVTGELLNLLTRMNLLYRIGTNEDGNYRVNVRLGTAEYPTKEAKNPSALAHKIRYQIGDEQRSMRIYGSEVVVGRLLEGTGRGRVLLLNYALRPVLGLRVRVRGMYTKSELRVNGVENARPADWFQDRQATEFTIPELHTFAVIDVSR